MSYNLGFIGGGIMASAIGLGILNNGAHPAEKTWVSGPHLENLQKWADLGANVTQKNGEVACKCDIVFLGIKPQMLSKAVDECLNTFVPDIKKNQEKLFVSMLAGVTIANLQRELSVLPIKARVIRIMPNTPMTVGAGACVYAPDALVTREQCAIVENLLNSSGISERVPEHMIDALGALSACGPAFMYMVIEALSDGAVKQGVPRATALKFAAQTMIGSGKMVLETGKHPGLLKDEVCSPGGSTICGVTALENGNLRATLISAIEASTLRNKELGKLN